MKKLSLLLILFVLLSGVVFSQNYYRRSSNRPLYFNPNTITRVEGKIISVDSVKMRVYTTTRLKVQTKDGPIDIITAPYWYLEKNKIMFKVGDTINVTGSKVTYDNKPLITASKINYIGKEIKFRDSNGFPLWAGVNNSHGRGSGRGRGQGRGRKRF